MRRISLSTTSRFFLLAAANVALSAAEAITKVLAGSDGVCLGRDLRYWPPAHSTISTKLEIVTISQFCFYDWVGVRVVPFSWSGGGTTDLVAWTL